MTDQQTQRILVVDDEPDLCEILLFNLAAAGYEVEAAFSADEALERVEATLREDKPFHLLLLDVMMPGMTGYELAARMKSDERTARVPVIFLTARDAEEDALKGFSLGADDYVTKPFYVREVVARVKAVLSRSMTAPSQPAVLSYQTLVLDTAAKRATMDGEDVALTKTEFELLALLLSHRGVVLSRQQLLDEAWPRGVIVTDRTVDVNVARLRKKIGPYAAHIVARPGFGYCFED